ncbi:Uncharacterized protein dnl_36590 [Desulfonema limicola]|uniref:Uncharacterized protein n=1 Tax=Desulfonema limicola TaxID=45656 RepID=A0A975GHD8_9BACT|nr:hypothetical protein [Desulfonema limicola]QTA81326.1 Uncharacterized protein dnl_36590 [Desulfonema limicola]
MVSLTVSAPAETDPQGQAAGRQAGMGGWKKRMPSCNEADRGSKFALTRKFAGTQT